MGMSGIKDLNSRIIACSGQAVELLGFKSFDQLYGKTDYDLNCKAVESAPTFIEQDQEVIKSRKTLKLLDIHTYADGKEHIWVGEKAPFYQDGVLTGVYITAIDMGRGFIQAYYSKLSKLLLDTEGTNPVNKMPSSVIIRNELPQLNLSKVEMLCFFYIVRGFCSSQIAERMSVSVRTVESYYDRIKNKLGCYTKKEIVEFAYQKGYTHFIPEELIF